MVANAEKFNLNSEATFRLADTWRDIGWRHSHAKAANAWFASDVKQYFTDSSKRESLAMQLQTDQNPDLEYLFIFYKSTLFEFYKQIGKHFPNSVLKSLRRKKQKTNQIIGPLKSECEI